MLETLARFFERLRRERYETPSQIDESIAERDQLSLRIVRFYSALEIYQRCARLGDAL